MHLQPIDLYVMLRGLTHKNIKLKHFYNLNIDLYVILRGLTHKNVKLKHFYNLNIVLYVFVILMFPLIIVSN